MKKFALPLFIFGVLISAFHWIGICISGLGMSFYGKSIKSKLLFGAFGGLLVWLAFTAYLSSTGAFEKAVNSGTLFNLSIFFSAVLGALSGLISAYELDY